MKRTHSGTGTVVSHNNTRMTPKRDTIPPLVFFIVGSEMSDQTLLNRYNSEKTTSVNIINVRFSNNGNVSIYTKSEEDNLKLENNEDLFIYSSRLNLQNIDREPCLMIKNITHEYAMEKEQSLKEKYDVKECVKIISKQDENKSIKMVNVILNKEEERKIVLKNGFMLIGCFKFLCRRIW
jgi:hypothetical protein